MGFFSRIKAKAESIAHRTEAIRKNVERALHLRPRKSEPLSFGIEYQTSVAAGKYDAKLSIVFNREITRELLDYLGSEGLKAVQDSLEPISRSGRLRDSFSYEINGLNTVIIGSNAPQAGSIASGIVTTPSIQSLMEWMLTKPEFSGMDKKRMRSVAGGIQQSIMNKNAPGKNSTLRRLNPTGQRAYNYFEVAIKDIEKTI